MGYRSDVRITMSKNAYKEFEKYVEEHINQYKMKNGIENSMYNYDYNLLHSPSIIKQTISKDQVYIGWDYLKWYDNYEEVNAIMDSLDKLEKNNYGFCYTRLGEDDCDFEERLVDSTDKDKIKNQECPSVERHFYDDKYIKMDRQDYKSREER